MRVILLALTLYVVSVFGVLPDGFVYLSDVDSSILEVIRYYSSHNFMGSRVLGYMSPRCVLTRPAAESLSLIQQRLLARGLSLKVWDCYRPQMAVDMFVLWANNSDNLLKQEFYPTLDKQDLFPEYIARRSGHSRGSTVDLTIVSLPAQPEEDYTIGDTLRPCFSADRFRDGGLDMGTGFDCCHPLAHTAASGLTDVQRANRALLLGAMESGGWVNYEGEWWHYTLQQEPYPLEYFDFAIQ
jgi:zinc D-Ala-D-Ala dipeptidase